MIVNSRGGNDDFGAVGFDVEAPNVRITGSSCTRCRAASYDYGYDGGFVEIWNHGDNLLVSGCTAQQTQGFLEVGGDDKASSARNVRILQNTMVEVHGGLFVHGSGQFSIPTSGIILNGNKITNRTAAKNGVLAGDLRNVEITNNVIVANQPLAFASPQRHTGNTYYLPGASYLGFNLGSGEKLLAFSAAR
jgi:hypothetical protein